MKSKQIVLASAAVLATGAAFALTSSDSDFADIVNMLTKWSEGTLGKTLALAMFIVGIAAGITQQSVMAAVVGVAGAMVMSYGPTIVGNVFSALV